MVLRTRINIISREEVNFSKTYKVGKEVTHYNMPGMRLANILTIDGIQSTKEMYVIIDRNEEQIAHNTRMKIGSITAWFALIVLLSMSLGLQRGERYERFINVHV